jgi:hypothetical protein
VNTPLLRILALLVGAFLLADSVSQLVQALGVWDPGSAVWRAGALRLLFTQVTPLMLALLLIGFGTVRSARGLYLAGGVGGALGLGCLALTALLVLDGSRSSAALTGDPLVQHQRGVNQGWISGLAAAVGLTLTALVLLGSARKESRSPLPATGP